MIDFGVTAYVAFGWIICTWLIRPFVYACERASHPKRDNLEDRVIQARLYNFNRRQRL